MTVGIAANGLHTLPSGETTPVVVMASDRMLTYSHRHEYEPLQTKIFPLTSSIRVLCAGDTGRLLAVCRATAQKLSQTTDIQIEEAAEALARDFAAERRRRAEQEVLGPFGLTIAEYLQHQNTFAPIFVDEINRSLSGAVLGAEAIVGGVDRSGAHLFVVRDPGVAECFDNVGFATIGIGADVASAEFMANMYAPSFDWVFALNIAYAAKRRAERAPGVGAMTDLAIIFADREVIYGGFSDLVRFLQATFDNRTQADLEAKKSDTKALLDFLAQQGSEMADPASSTTASQGEPAAARAVPSQHRNEMSNDQPEGTS